MRVLIDIPEEDLKQVAKVTREQGISRAEFVRRAIKSSLEAKPPSRGRSGVSGTHAQRVGP
jgi:metal-responsive CopG/Arc/MetJ family transcriptional regulator